MKSFRKRIVALMLVCLMSVGCILPAYAAEMEGFPYQNQKSFSTAYTRAVQVMLMHYNAETRNLIQQGGVDGSFGPKTAEAVMAFQRAKGLSQDGSCGPATWKALRYALILKSDKSDSVYNVYDGPYPYIYWNMRQAKVARTWWCYWTQWNVVG